MGISLVMVYIMGGDSVQAQNGNPNSMKNNSYSSFSS
jgi:hypothetical protein